MKRLDLSDYLTHWVSGESEDDALQSLTSIIMEKKITGNTSIIKGSYSCVCFTETPMEHFNFITSRYWPFGIRVLKRHVFELGGRPVIYQRDSEFYDLPELLRWRHVRYEPDIEPPIDFTWEREWRIKTEAFKLDPNEIKIIVLNRDAETKLNEVFDRHEWDRYYSERIGYGESVANYPEPIFFSIKLINK